MRIAVNLLGLPSVRQGGAGFAAETLVRGLAAHPGARPVVIAGPQVAGELDDAAEVRVVAGRCVRGPMRAAGGAVALARSRHDPRRFGRQVPAALVAGCDVVHYPLSFMDSPVHDRPCVITALDLAHLEFPAHFSRIDRLLRARRWHPALRGADRVIAPSRHTAAALRARLGIAADRIDVVVLGCHDAFFAASPAARPAGPFVLYPAAPLPGKNHRRLLRAFRGVAARHADLRLVLCGPALHDWAEVRRACREEGLQERVVLAGHLGLGDLRAHYAAARLVVFPSLCEGFGLPLVEAMAAGCLVVTSDAASLPEVAGDAALFFDPARAEAIEEAIERGLALSTDERAKLVEAGRRRARDFTSGRFVAATMASYARAVGDGVAPPP